MPNSFNNILKKKFEKLISDGDRIISEIGWAKDGHGLIANPNPVIYASWKAEALNLIAKTNGKDSEHYAEFINIQHELSSDVPYLNFPKYLGVLKGLFNDLNEGLLVDIKYKIRAELVDDYLEQAKILLDDGYYIPAASLAGAVLEDTLRRISDKNQISYLPKTKIDSLNIELAKNGTYDKLTQKLITAYADIRNNADHGNFKLVKKADVDDMIKWIYKFVSENLN